MKYRVENMMTNLVHCVGPDTSMQELKRLFQKQGISAAPVADKMGALLGVISKTNLLNASLAKDRQFDFYPDFFHMPSYQAGHEHHPSDVFTELAGTVKEYMTKDSFTIGPDEDLSVAARTMFENRIHHLIVTKHDKVVGVISSFDILKCYPLLDQLEHLGNESVGSLMKTQVVNIEMEQTIAAAKQILEQRSIRQLPVIHHGRLVGILTDRDIRRAELSRLVNPESEEENNYYMGTIPVAEIMSKPVTTVTAFVPVRAAAETLLKQKFGALPVVDATDATRLVGILTRSDILRYVTRR